MPKTPHISRRSQAAPELVDPHAEQRSAPGGAQPLQPDAGRRLGKVRVGRQRQDRLSAALAEERDGLVRKRRARRRSPTRGRLRPGRSRGLPRRSRGRACSCGATRGEEAHEGGLGGEVELGRRSARLAELRLVLGAGQAEWPGGGEVQLVARTPAARNQTHVVARGRRSRRPASAGSRRRRCRCRARRCRRPPGCRAPRTPGQSLRSPRPAPSRPRGFSGLPKLRQSVIPSGSPPAQATLRAASRTASAPPVNGSSAPIRPVPSSVTARPRYDGRSRSTAASRPGRRTVRDCTSWS